MIEELGLVKWHWLVSEAIPILYRHKDRGNWGTEMEGSRRARLGREERLILTCWDLPAYLVVGC